MRFTRDDQLLVATDAGEPRIHVFAAPAGCWTGVVSYPAATFTVMDSDEFGRRERSPGEGGPKGIDIDAEGRVLVMTSEFVPLAFFDLAAALAGEGRRDAAALVDYERHLARLRASRPEDLVALREAREVELAHYKDHTAWLDSVVTRYKEHSVWVEAEVTRSRELIVAMQAELVQLRATVEPQRAELSLAVDEADRLRARCEVLEHDLAEWSSALERVYHSKAWRLTAPLRAVRSLVGRVARVMRRR